MFRLRSQAQTNTLLLLVLFAAAVVSCTQEKVPRPGDLNKPLPNFLLYISPVPGSALPLASYQSGEHYATPYGPSPAETRNSICAQIDPEPLLEPGDYYESRSEVFDFLPERVKPSVDGQELPWNVDEIVVVLGDIELRNETGELIAETAGPQIACWMADLTSGSHVARIEVVKTSGETMEYAWSFTLLD